MPETLLCDAVPCCMLCAVQTLSNPEARAMYDAIAGFSIDAINPFMDASYPADQVKRCSVVYCCLCCTKLTMVRTVENIVTTLCLE